VIIGTAGHIDHGKTTLVRALTGIDTDRLKEEKQRGISIELGYAYVPLANGEMLGFVDVPGHERLIHTMTAGASGIDFALFVIAADDGVMPQTREHLAILDLLGIRHGAVALTKADRVDPARIAQVRDDVHALFDASASRGAPMFVVNALRADDPGLAALRDYLQAAAIASERRSSAGLFRLAVDRVFTLAGYGTIVAGTVHAGAVNVGDIVSVMPQGLTARVRSIHANNRETTLGLAGQRCAINLAGLETSQLTRGDWLADARAFEPSIRIDVRLQLLKGATALRNWTPVHVHVGATHRLAHVVPLDTDVVAPGGVARMQFVFDTPICVATGDRLIVRDAQARHTLGGGRVLDANAPTRKRRSAERMRYLDAIESLLDGDGLAALINSAPFGLAVADLERITSSPAAMLILPAATRTTQAKQNPYVVGESRWQSLYEMALAAVAKYHAQSPEEAGVEITRLRRIAAPAMPESPWRALIDELIAAGRLLRNGPWLHLPEHHILLSVEETVLADRVAPLIAAGAFDPPWVRDLAAAAAAPENNVRRTLRKLTTQGAMHQVVPDLFYTVERVRELATIVAELDAAHGAATAAAFRDRVGTGRKRAIQILEFFDRVGYTRRVHDAHRLRGEHEGFF
jgi:selenocysteine-specific elongation factor